MILRVDLLFEWDSELIGFWWLCFDGYVVVYKEIRDMWDKMQDVYYIKVLSINWCNISVIFIFNDYILLFLCFQ